VAPPRSGAESRGASARGLGERGVAIEGNPWEIRRRRKCLFQGKGMGTDLGTLESFSQFLFFPFLFLFLFLNVLLTEWAMWVGSAAACE